MPLQTNAESHAAAEYHDPHCLLNNLIHAARHRQPMQYAAEYHDPPCVLNNLINAARHRKLTQNTILQVNTMTHTGY